MALKDDLDAADIEQRKQATDNLLKQISWYGTSDFMNNLAQKRIRQFCEEMNVQKELMRDLFLAAAGRGSIGAGGASVHGELTSWDGTKKNTGWGISYAFTTIFGICTLALYPLPLYSYCNVRKLAEDYKGRWFHNPLKGRCDRNYLS